MIRIEPPGGCFRFRRSYFARGCARAHPMGVAPEPSGVSSRVARGVVSDPSWVRLKDLVFHQLDIFRGGRGIPFVGISFRADLARARPWIETSVMLAPLILDRSWTCPQLGRSPSFWALGGPKREKISMTCVSQMGRVRIRLVKANRPPRFFGGRG